MQLLTEWPRSARLSLDIRLIINITTDIVINIKLLNFCHHEYWPNLQGQHVSLSTQEWRHLVDEPTAMTTMFSLLYHNNHFQCSMFMITIVTRGWQWQCFYPCHDQFHLHWLAESCLLVPELVAAWHWYPPWSSSFTFSMKSVLYFGTNKCFLQEIICKFSFLAKHSKATLCIRSVHSELSGEWIMSNRWEINRMSAISIT